MKLLLILATLLLGGCASGTGAHWYAPATWFSHAPADAADRAQQKETAAERAAIKLAQRASHETQIALGSAAHSRPVAIARESNDLTVGLLTQAAGPLTAGETAAVRSTVAGLLSEDPAVRARAEKAHADDNAGAIEISARLAKAHAASEAADKNLRLAFERENELANQLRSQRALVWILGGCAVLALIGWVYVRFFLGGIPGALGSVLAQLETKSPSAAEELRGLLDTATNRHEQSTIRDAYLKAR